MKVVNAYLFGRCTEQTSRMSGCAVCKAAELVSVGLQAETAAAVLPVTWAERSDLSEGLCVLLKTSPFINSCINEGCFL